MTRSTEENQDWVATLSEIDPDLSSRLLRVGIRDEVTYQEREIRLPDRVRTLVAQTRRDLLLLELIPLPAMVRAAPPWLQDQEPERVGVPKRLRLLAGASRVRDLERGAGRLTPNEIRVIRLALYAAGRGPAPEVTPATSTQRRVQRLVRAAPERVREARIGSLPGLKTRLRNTLRSGGVAVVSDLDAWTDDAIRALPGVGERTVADLISHIEAAIRVGSRGDAGRG